MANCSICLGTLSSEEEGTSELPCGHVFHSECLVPWLWRNKSCPNCRTTHEDSITPRIEEYNFDLEEILQRIRAIETERKRAFNRIIRKSSQKNASPTLVRKVRYYKKWREEIKKTTRLYNEHCRMMRKHDNNLATIQRKLYSDYLQKYAENISIHNMNINHDILKGRQLARRLRLQKKYMNRFQCQIMLFESRT